MSEKTYHLNFDGYWREPNINGLPAQSSIYCVYRCTYDAGARTVSISKLIYIGESSDVRDRVANHEKWDEWRRHLRYGEQLCFNTALISGDSDRQRAEAAMIYEHKPPCNTDYIDSFPFDKITIHTSGKNNRLKDYFTVYPSTSEQRFPGVGYSNLSRQ